MSTDYKQAFAKLKKPPEWKPTPNVAFEIKGFEGKPVDTIRGVALNGPNAGEEMRIRLSKNAHAKAPPISDFAKKSALVCTGVGGVLQAEGLTKAADGVFETRWLAVLSKNLEKNPVHLDVWASVKPITQLDRETNTRTPVTDSNGIQRFNVNALAPDREIEAKTFDDFKAAMVEAAGKPPIPAAEGGRGVVVTLHAPSGDSMRLPFLRGSEPAKEGEPYTGKPVESMVDAVIERFGGEEQVKKFFDDGVKVGVMPFAVMNIGSKSAEKLVADMAAHDGRGRTIDTSGVDNGSGVSTPGYMKASVVTGFFVDDEGNHTGGSYIYRVARSDSSRPIPFEAINSPVLPDATKDWRERNSARAQEQKQEQTASAPQETGGKPDVGATESKPAVEKKAAPAPAQEEYDEAAELDHIMGMVENMPTGRDEGPEV